MPSPPLLLGPWLEANVAGPQSPLAGGYAIPCPFCGEPRHVRFLCASLFDYCTNDDCFEPLYWAVCPDDAENVADAVRAADADLASARRTGDEDRLRVALAARRQARATADARAEGRMSHGEWVALRASFEAPLRSSAPGPPPAPDGNGGGPSRVHPEDVVSFIEDNYDLIRSTDGLLFAVPAYPGAHRVAREIGSIGRDVLRRFREDRAARTGRGHILNPEVLRTALSAIAAYAEDMDETPVALRSAQVGSSRVILDLGDPIGTVVEVTAAGWALSQPRPDLPLFRRSAATRPLPTPTRGGSLDALRDLLGLAEGDARWLLVRGWLVASLFASIPRPLLWATGPQGSGKSTRARMALSLIEPTEALGKEPGRNERDDSTAARARFLVSYDNIATINQATSDWLCRLVTGVTDDRRELYTDDGLRPVSYRRSGVATSIVLPPGLGSDALERLVLLQLDRIPDEDRRGETGPWTAFTAAHPALLGALLDDVVRVLAHLSTVAEEARSWPRMADYAHVLAALDRGLGLPDDSGHLAAYVDAVDGSLAERALDDPFTSVVIDFVRERGGTWRGSSTDLLSRLDLVAGQRFDRPRWWPTSARALTIQLRTHEEALRHAGVTYTHGKTGAARWIELGTHAGADASLSVPPTGTHGTHPPF